MDVIQNNTKFRVAYLFQNTGTNFTKPYAAQLHILHTLYGLQKRGHSASLYALQPQRRVIYTDDLEAVTNDQLTERHYATPGKRDGKRLRFIESAFRRFQRSVNFPYLALFDDLRMYDSACRNLTEIHLIHERYSGIAAGGAFASKKLGIPFILEVNADIFDQSRSQGISITGLQHKVFNKKTRYCFDQADKIICVSEQLRTHLINKWKLPPEKTVTLACAADVDAFGRDYDKKTIRKNLYLDQEPVVIWIGGFYKWHDLDLLLESFIKVVDVLPHAKLVLVGDGKNRASFEQKVKDIGFDRSVMMVGLVEHAKIPEILSIADVAVAPAPLLPARDGGTGAPLKLFEYMAAGKAIVANDVYQSASVIQNGSTGILVEPGNVEGFAEAIIKLLVDEEERDRLAYNARVQAIDHHSWDQYILQLEEIYASVL